MRPAAQRDSAGLSELKGVTLYRPQTSNRIAAACALCIGNTGPVLEGNVTIADLPGALAVGFIH
ncbi:hypothetical protein [Hymenobacter rubidus]|uniref:hypothetical protein n=1 Tax=Hymenobacter rubidus TaxID=1441626 RepID=UPI00191CA2D4|nr:hypothetical protein [Hymenobacter rubidus]